MLLESLGQAIRGAAFAIPGSLGVQEGGYLLLAPLVGLPPDAALALSLAKRAREILLGLPGLLYLHFSERTGNGGAPRACRCRLIPILERGPRMRAIILAAGLGLRLQQSAGGQFRSACCSSTA